MNNFLSFFESGLPAIFAVITIVAIFVIIERQLKIKREKKDKERLRNEKEFAQSKLDGIYKELESVILKLQENIAITDEGDINIRSNQEINESIGRLSSIIMDKTVEFTIVNKKEEIAKYRHQRTRVEEIPIRDIFMIKSIKGTEERHLFMEVPGCLTKSKNESKNDFEKKFKLQLRTTKYETVENITLSQFCMQHEDHFLQLTKDIICNKSYVKINPAQPDKIVILKNPSSGKELFFELPRKGTRYHQMVTDYLSKQE